MKPSEQQKITLDSFQVAHINLKVDTFLDKTITKNPKLNLNYSVLRREGAENERFGIQFNIKLENSDTGFLLDVSAIAHFLMANVTDVDKFIESDFVKLNAPAIAFPYLRSFITTIIINSGFNPIILPTFNFSNISSESEIVEENKVNHTI